MRAVFKLLTRGAIAFAVIATFAAAPALAAKKKEFNVAWTIYAGWMPWQYLQDSGMMKKWADKYGIKVNIVQINDYVESINQYTAGKFDACAMTNMDALTIPAAGGVDSTALIVGDFSNGNDGIVLKKPGKLTNLKGMKINLVELSVSHYLLARALDTVKLSEKDITVVNTSDADMVSVFSTAPGVTAAVAWNPQLATIKKLPGATEVFDSSKIPGEIIDMMVVNTDILKDNPELGKALTGAWFEIMALMTSNTPASKVALEAMAKASGTDLAGYNAQLKTTMMFYKAADAVKFVTSPQLPKTMDLVASFSFDHGLLGKDAKSKNEVGFAYPGGKVAGNAKNVKLRFDVEYMKMAADGKL